MRCVWDGSLNRVLAGLALLASALPALAADWPQLQNGPQRQGYSPESVGLPFSNTWVRGFAPDRVYPQVQPVVSAGKVMIGTKGGKFYAFNAANGTQVWVFSAGGPILSTAAVVGTKVIVPCLDGKIYAVNVADGMLSWIFNSRKRTGFSTAILAAEGRVYVANRNGTYYALDPNTGDLIWKQEVGAPVLMSSAYDAGRIFVPAMDMKVRALDASSGMVLWTSAALPGTAFRDYWPVAYNGYVLVRPARMKDTGGYGPGILATRGPLPQSELDNQTVNMADSQANPTHENLFVLNQRDGQKAFIVPHWTTCTMNGAATPPCVDGGGLLITPCHIKNPANGQDWYGGWGRLDLTQRRVVETLWDGTYTGGGYPTGTGNTDENMTVSAAGKLVFTLHTEEFNAQYTGVWTIDARVWTPIGPYHANQYYSNNAQGGGGSPAVVSGGRLYHVTYNNLNCRTLTAVP